MPRRAAVPGRPTVRGGLGHGSGQESPGFNAILDAAPRLWVAYSALLERAGVTPLAIQMDPEAHSVLFQLSEALERSLQHPGGEDPLSRYCPWPIRAPSACRLAVRSRDSSASVPRRIACPSSPIRRR